MAKELVRLAPGIRYLPGGTNLGLLVNEERSTAVAVDAGMDKDAAKGLLNAAAAAGLTIEALFLTHAHADHFGGASYLRERTGAKVYATGLEAAVIANPLLEPLYLFAGGTPPAALRGKFLLGQPCLVDRVVAPGETVELAGLECRVETLPGHSPAQAGLAWGPALFCGDAFFPEAILAKHPIPVFTDPAAARSTLALLAASSCEWVIPGHGMPVRRGAELERTCSANLAALERVAVLAGEALSRGPLTLDDVVGEVAVRSGAELKHLADVCLARLTVQAVLGELLDLGALRTECREGRLVWGKTEL